MKSSDDQWKDAGDLPPWVRDHLYKLNSVQEQGRRKGRNRLHKRVGVTLIWIVIGVIVGTLWWML